MFEHGHGSVAGSWPLNLVGVDASTFYIFHLYRFHMKLRLDVVLISIINYFIVI